MNQVECCLLNVYCILFYKCGYGYKLQVVVFGVRNGKFSVKKLLFFY